MENIQCLPEAMQTALYVLNRLGPVTRKGLDSDDQQMRAGLQNTPIARWRRAMNEREQPTTLSHLREWYCKVYMNIPIGYRERVKRIRCQPARGWATLGLLP